MGRRRTIPDADIYRTIRRQLAEGGDKAVAFSSVARATGLAAPTLVQRYGSREAMVQAALLDGWDLLAAATETAAEAAPMTAKGAVALLKELEGWAGPSALQAADLRDAALRARAAAWRRQVEAALAVRLGGGAKAREAAAMLFAAWQGQALWTRAEERAFRLKDLVKRLD
jgi:hypothetical protein